MLFDRPIVPKITVCWGKASVFLMRMLQRVISRSSQWVTNWQDQLHFPWGATCNVKCKAIFHPVRRMNEISLKQMSHLSNGNSLFFFAPFFFLPLPFGCSLTWVWGLRILLGLGNVFRSYSRIYYSAWSRSHLYFWARRRLGRKIMKKEARTSFEGDGANIGGFRASLFVISYGK